MNQLPWRFVSGLTRSQFRRRSQQLSPSPARFMAQQMTTTNKNKNVAFLSSLAHTRRCEGVSQDASEEGLLAISEVILLMAVVIDQSS